MDTKSTRPHQTRKDYKFCPKSAKRLTDVLEARRGNVKILKPQILKPRFRITPA